MTDNNSAAHDTNVYLRQVRIYKDYDIFCPRLEESWSGICPSHLSGNSAHVVGAQGSTSNAGQGSGQFVLR